LLVMTEVIHQHRHQRKAVLIAVRRGEPPVTPVGDLDVDLPKVGQAGRMMAVTSSGP
jgi:hypothetical protein